MGKYQAPPVSHQIIKALAVDELFLNYQSAMDTNWFDQSPALSETPSTAHFPLPSINILNEISEPPTISEQPIIQRSVITIPSSATNIYPELQEKIKQELKNASPHFLSVWTPELNDSLKNLITWLMKHNIDINDSFYRLIRANNKTKNIINFISKCVSIIKMDSQNTIKNTEDLSKLFLSTDDDNKYDKKLLEEFRKVQDS